MPADLWPQYGLAIVTPRLELRLPGEEELAEFADLAVRVDKHQHPVAAVPSASGGCGAGR